MSRLTLFLSSNVFKHNLWKTTCKSLSDTPRKKAETPVGQLDDSVETEEHKTQPIVSQRYDRFPNDINPVTGERDGPRGPEPTRYGDWERKGRCIDF